MRYDKPVIVGHDDASLLRGGLPRAPLAGIGRGEPGSPSGGLAAPTADHQQWPGEECGPMSRPAASSMVFSHCGSAGR